MVLISSMDLHVSGFAVQSALVTGKKAQEIHRCGDISQGETACW